MSVDKQKLLKLTEVSDPLRVNSNLKKYFKNDKHKPVLFLSTRKDKKYMIIDPSGKYIHFGDKNYKDFTNHEDINRQTRYLSRANKIKGNWIGNKYSPNNLSINLLWQ